mgnify:CR=1 FL=1|jgi:hypothetical protein|tara:strand:- start:70 stop:738 length:669 start_codon:yes stop_codon:yes gene_type:complete
MTSIFDISFILNHPYFQPYIIKSFYLLFGGLIIRQSLVIVGQRWANTYHHLGTYLLLPNIALLITSVIKDDIALSLGMIGALSIVRFRNPVKSPFELVMFFSLMSLGIVCSVSLALSFLLFSLVVLVIFGIKISDYISKKFKKNIYQFSFGDGNMLYTIEIESSDEMNDLIKKKSLIHFYIDKKNKVYSYRLVFKNREELISFQDSIQNDKRIISARADIQS